MPLAVDRLTPDSPLDAIQEAISQSIGQCMNEPIPEGTDAGNKQEYCAGKVHGIAREKTGQALEQGRQQ